MSYQTHVNLLPKILGVHHLLCIDLFFINYHAVLCCALSFVPCYLHCCVLIMRLSPLYNVVNHQITMLLCLLPHSSSQQNIVARGHLAEQHWGHAYCRREGVCRARIIGEEEG